MFTFDRKPPPSSAPSPGLKLASQGPGKAAPPSEMWSRLTTSSNAGAAISPVTSEEMRRYFEPLSPIQPKASVSSPGDPDEREADEVADKVMRTAEAGPVGLASGAIQRERAPSAHTGAEQGAEAAVRAAERDGEPLPGELRSYFEPRFGHDFSGVRLHVDGEAANAARAVQARAYTVGQSIVLGAGEYAPGTSEGKRLLAHELTHVVQQSRSGAPAPSGTVQRKPGDSAEKTEDPTPNSQWTVITPERGNLRLRVVADHPKDLKDGSPNSVGNLSSGTVVEVIEKKNDLGWYTVKGEVGLDGGKRGIRTGFVHRSYLFPVAAKPAEEPKTPADPAKTDAPAPQAAADPAAIAVIQALLAHSKQTFNSAEMSVAEAQRLIGAIEKTQATLSAYGPRLLALRLLRDIAGGGASVPAGTLADRIRKYKPVTVMRPDGYLAWVLDGAAIQRIGTVEFSDAGVLKAGTLEVGTFYYSDQGVLYRTDEAGQRTGSSVGELGLDHDLPNKVLDGVADAGEALASGLAKLLLHPIESLEGLAKLPQAVKFLIMNSPVYWDRFKAMPLGDQVREVSKIITTLVTLYGSSAGAATKISAAVADIGTVTVRTLVLAEDGTLAVSTATVNVGAAATVMGAGPGGVFIMHMTNQAGSGGGSGGKPPAEAPKEPPGKAPSPQPAARAAATAASKPGKLTVDSAIAAGKVNPGGLLEKILRGIENEFLKGAPKNADQAAELATKVTDRLSTQAKPVTLGRFAKYVQEEGGYQLWQNSGGVTTKFFESGVIMVLKDGIMIFCMVP